MISRDWDRALFPWVAIGCALFVLFMLGACAAPSTIRGTGEAVAPPRGWVDYCYRHLSDVDCKPLRAEIDKAAAEAKATQEAEAKKGRGM